MIYVWIYIKQQTTKHKKLAKILSTVVCLMRSIASGLLALFLFSSLMTLLLGIGSAAALLIVAPFATLMALAFFALREDWLNKRIFRLLNSKNLITLLLGNNIFYIYEADSNTQAVDFEIQCALFFYLVSDLEEHLQNETHVALNRTKKAWNTAVFIASILATVIESGTIFYSSYKVLNNIALLLAPSVITTLIPLIYFSAIVCTIGAFISFYGTSAVAIRNKLRYKHPVSELKTKEKLGMRVARLGKFLGTKLQNSLTEVLINTKLSSKFYAEILKSVISKTEENYSKNKESNCDWISVTEKYIQESIKEALIPKPMLKLNSLNKKSIRSTLATRTKPKKMISKL